MADAMQEDPTRRQETPQPEGKKPAGGARAAGSKSTAPTPFSTVNAPIDSASNLPVSLQSRYRLVSVLGKGGFANVYLAYDNVLDQQVAIKVLKLNLASANDRDRFLFEARVGAKLRHPNIINIFDIIQTADGLQMVMEFVPGGTLSERIKKKGPVPPREAIDIMRQVATALSHAHKSSIIHRDVKPANIFVTGDGSVKLGDFGIAAHSDSHEYTQTGMIIGTPLYMPPEQSSDSRDVDPRTDVYALGLTLYHMLTGLPPRVVDLDIVPTQFRALIKSATAQNRHERLVSMGQFIAQLDQIKDKAQTVHLTATANSREIDPEDEDIPATKKTDVHASADPAGRIPITPVSTANTTEATGEVTLAKAAQPDNKKNKGKYLPRLATALLLPAIALAALLPGWLKEQERAKRRQKRNEIVQPATDGVRMAAEVNPVAATPRGGLTAATPALDVPPLQPSLTPAPTQVAVAMETPAATAQMTGAPETPAAARPTAEPTMMPLKPALRRLLDENRRVELALRNMKASGPIREKQLQAAVEILREESAKNPENPLIQLVLAIAYQRAGQTRLAREVYQQAHETNAKLRQPIDLQDRAPLAEYIGGKDRLPDLPAMGPTPPRRFAR